MICGSYDNFEKLRMTYSVMSLTQYVIGNTEIIYARTTFLA